MTNAGGLWAGCLMRRRGMRIEIQRRDRFRIWLSSQILHPDGATFGRLRSFAPFELRSSNQVLREYQTKKGSIGPLFCLARPERFELPTNWFEANYSIQLSYGRIEGWILAYPSTSFSNRCFEILRMANTPFSLPTS